MRQIFMSYDQADEIFAVNLTDDLVAYGANVWLDVRNARPGRHWARSISGALGESSMMVVVLSPDALVSLRVAAEWQSYLEAYRPVLPVVIRHCDPPGPLRTRRPVDITRERFYYRAFHELMNRLIDCSTRVQRQPASVPWSLTEDRYDNAAVGAAGYSTVSYSAGCDRRPESDAATTIRRLVQGLCARLGR